MIRTLVTVDGTDVVDEAVAVSVWLFPVQPHARMKPATMIRMTRRVIAVAGSV